MSNCEIKLTIDRSELDRQMPIIMADLKKLRAEFEAVADLRDRALRPRWITRIRNRATRAKHFFFGQKIPRMNIYGEQSGWVGIAPGWRDWLRGPRFRETAIPPHDWTKEK